LQEEHRSSETHNADNGSDEDGLRPSSLQAEQHYEADIEKPRNDQENPEEEVDRQIRAFRRWILIRAKQATFIDFVEIVTGIILVVVGIIAVCIYDGQLAEMRSTNELTRKALNGNDRALVQTLEQMKAQVAAMSTLATNAGTQATQTTNLVAQATRSAAAAKSAADTARDALHISEKAYIITYSPTFDAEAHVITMNLSNAGRIPAGKVRIEAHVGTYTNQLATGAYNSARPTEIHWQSFELPSFPPGPPSLVTIPAPQMSAELLNARRQMVLLAGYVIYNDGFPNTPDVRLPFCFRTIFFAATKGVSVIPCDEKLIPDLMRVDGYPQNDQATQK
jgi:hypothetical protein